MSSNPNNIYILRLNNRGYTVENGTSFCKQLRTIKKATSQKTLITRRGVFKNKINRVGNQSETILPHQRNSIIENRPESA